MVKYNQQDDEVKIGSIFEAIWRRKRTFFTITGSCVAIALILALVLPKKYTAEAQMIWNARGPQYTTNPNDYQKPVETIDTIIGLLQSDFMIGRTYQWLETSSGLPADQLLQVESKTLDYRVENAKLTNILAVSASARTPQEAVAIANGICNSFIDWNRGIAQDDLLKTESSLQVQAANALTKLKADEAEQQKLQTTTGTVDVTLQNTALITRMATLTQQIDGMQQQVASDEANVATVQDQLRHVDNVISGAHSFRDDGNLALLQQQLEQAEIALADAKQRYTSQYPAMLDPLEAKVADLTRRVNDSIKLSLNVNGPSLQSQAGLTETLHTAIDDLNIHRAALAAIEASRDQVQSQFSKAPAVRLENDLDDQNVIVDKATYAAVRSSLSETELMLAHVNGDIQLTDPAALPSPVVPSFPNPLLFVALGLALGLILSIGYILFADRNETIIYKLDKLRLVLPAQPIGGLEDLNPKNKTLTIARNANLLEPITAYSIAVANLDLLWSRLGHDRHTVLVTSAVAGEGKTTTSYYLAKIFAKSGRSVLLVDADFGNPSIKGLFASTATAGLYEVLHQAADVNDAIQQTDVPNLSVIFQSGTGHVAQTPEIASPSAIRGLVAELSTLADVVIFDSPPATASSDTLQFAPHVDTIVHVIGLGIVQEPALNQTAIGLRLAHPTTYVTFINHLDQAQGYYSPYYYTGPASNLPLEPSGQLLLSGPTRAISVSTEEHV